MLNLASKWPNPFEKRRLRQISAYNVSTVRDTEKLHLWRIGNRPRAFQRVIDGVRTAYVISKSPKGSPKPIFQFFGIKFNFNRIKSATKFRCVKTYSDKVVEQSISFEVTEKHRTESVSFHLKYWLKLTYAVVARCYDLGHDSAQCCRMTSCLQ